MANLSGERILYSEIQKRLLYLVPEKWQSIHLYASIVDSKDKKTVGELYFYYIPKGVLKKNPINVYEIPAKFSINDEEYLKLVQ